MKKVLIAVDDTKHSKAVLASFYNLVRSPEEAVLLHVENPGGKSLMYDMLGDAEMSTLKEMLEGTEHKDAMDLKAGRILTYYKNALEDSNTAVTTMVRAGNPAEEIVKAAEEVGAELVILGHSGRKGLHRLISGSVTNEIKERAQVPVLVAKDTPVLMCEEPYTWRDASAAIVVCTAIVIALFIFGIIVEKNAFLP